MWPPPEGTSQPPPEELNPLVKLLMDVSATQESLLEDHLLLSNKFNLHRCSDYCLKNSKNNLQSCRMEFPKPERQYPAIVKDKNSSLRLEMPRDHPVLVQHSKYHTQGWRANGDISLILSKSDPENPSVNEILATEKYITGYACKGNQPTGAVADLFNDMVNCSTDTSSSAKSICTRLLMNSVKRDISSVEACYELSSIPLYRSSHTFQSVSLSGSRILEKGAFNLTRNTALDKYIHRDENDNSSFYAFLCRSGKVPVITGCNTQATLPLEENFCQTSLLLHFPNWRNISDIKNESASWVQTFISFLDSENCPNFLKAEVERAKDIEKFDDNEAEEEINSTCNSVDESEWMNIIRPCANFENNADFEFDDGGPSHDWTATSYEYPENEKDFSNIMETKLQGNSNVLQIPNVDVQRLNTEQRFAFNIVLKTIGDCFEKTDNYKPLRMVVSGTAGSGKSYLIKCLVKTIRLMCN